MPTKKTEARTALSTKGLASPASTPFTNRGAMLARLDEPAPS